MKHDNLIMGDLYQMISENVQINEGSMPFNSAKFTDSLKSAARFISNGTLGDLGVSGIRHILSKFHMDRAAKKEAANVLQQQGAQLGMSPESISTVKYGEQKR
jgi:hypothetical protein